MDNTGLINYIKEGLAAGMRRQEIVGALLQAGWTQSVVDDGFVELEGKQTSQSIPSGVSNAGLKNVPLSPQPIGLRDLKNSSLPASTVVAPQHNIKDTALRPQGSRRNVMKIIIVFAILVAMGGGTIYAYVMKIGPFARIPYSENNLMSGLLLASSRIHSSAYTLSGSVSVGARDADAKPYVNSLMNNRDFLEKYRRDVKRARDINAILQTLRYVRVFPASLTSIYRVSSLNDPGTNQPYGYVMQENGKNFSLTATFETDSAISQIKGSYGFSPSSTQIAGKQVSFTKDSSSYVYLPSDPPKPLLAQYADALSFFPAKGSMNVAASAQADWNKSDTDWKFNINASGDFDDLTYKVDIDALKKSGIYYFKINHLPSLFLASLSAIKGEWIKIDASAASTSPSGYYDVFSSFATQIPKTEKSYKQYRQEFTDVLKKVAMIADEEHLLTFKKAPYSERVDGRSLYRYDLKINKDAVVRFYRRLLNETDTSKIRNVFFSDVGYLEYLQSKEFSEIFDYYDKNASFTIWVDTKGFPGVISYTARVVPPDTAMQLKDKQVNMVMSLALSHINEPIDIKEPSNAKPIQDFIKKSGLGLPVIKSRDARRVADIKQTQLALELFFDTNSGYPKTLAELAPTFIPQIPTDPSNQSSYSYTYHYHVKGGKNDSYHLGAGLEDVSSAALENDADCNSLTGSGCIATGSYSQLSAFDGSDTKGCKGETDRYCYDVMP